MPYLDPSNDKPWLPPAVIVWLEGIVKPEWTVLETGSGGSTVWFAQRAAHVISYENDKGWYDKVAFSIAAFEHLGMFPPSRSTLRLRPGYSPAGLFQQDTLPALDLAFIDGRGRVRSIKDAFPHVVRGGWIMLDDSQRTRYNEAHALLDPLAQEKRTFTDGPDQTTAWRM